MDGREVEYVEAHPGDARQLGLDAGDLAKFGSKALELCLKVPHNKPSDLEQLAEVAILIVADRKMASLHQKFMNEAGPTDVITFQHGEIFISAEMARRNAKRFGNSLRRELELYVVHGLLHLHGFDDRDAENARKMQLVQREILAKAMV